MKATTILSLASTALDSAEVIHSLIIRITEMINQLKAEGFIDHTQQQELLNYMSNRYRVVQGRLPRQPWETIEPDPGSGSGNPYDASPINPGYHQTR